MLGYRCIVAVATVLMCTGAGCPWATLWTYVHAPRGRINARRRARLGEGTTRGCLYGYIFYFSVYFPSNPNVYMSCRFAQLGGMRVQQQLARAAGSFPKAQYVQFHLSNNVSPERPTFTWTTIC